MNPGRIRTVLFVPVLCAIPALALGQAPTPREAAGSTPAAPTPADTAEAAASAEAPPTITFIEVVSGGLTADRAAAMAIQTSDSIARVDAVVRVAEAGSMQALASVLPQITLSGRATYTNRIVNDLSTATPDQIALAQAAIDSVRADPANPSNGTIATLLEQVILGSANIRFPYYRSQYEFQAQLQYPVSAAIFTLLPLYRAAGFQVDAANVQRDIELAQIALRARESFYEHVRARAALAVATEALHTVEANRDQVRALVDAGVASRADLLQIEAQVANADVSVRNAALGVEISARALGILITADGEPIPQIEIGEDVSQPIEVSVEEVDQLEQTAFANRGELEAIRLSIRARTLEARAQSAARFPQLSVAANAQYANPNNRYIPQAREFRGSWDLNAVLSWSPNDTLVAEGRMRAARAQRDQLEAQTRELREAVRLEVTQAYQQLVATRATMDSATAAVTAAREAFRVRTEQLAQGVIVSTELLESRTALTRAELALVDASVQTRIAQARLVRATGGDVPQR